MMTQQPIQPKQRLSFRRWLFFSGLMALVVVLLVVWAFVQFVAFPNIKRAVHQTVENEANQFIRLVERKAATTELDLAAQLLNAQVHLVKDNQENTYPSKFPADTTLKNLFNPTDFATSDLVILEHPKVPQELVAISRLQDGRTFYLTKPWPNFKEIARNDTYYVVILAIIASIILISVITWMTYQKIVRPLRAITQTAHRINEGFLDDEVQIDNASMEFSELSRAINIMADKFREDISVWKKMNAIQSEFLSDVSHEVRNPIFSVSGYLEGLADGGLSDTTRKKFSEKGLSNLNRVQSLFDDLLDISKLEFGEGQNIYPDVFDIKGLVEEVADSVQMAASLKNIQIDHNTHSVKVFADRKRIGQVLTNLAQNAVNYMDKADGSISLRYRRYRDKLRVEVIDTGCGIAESHLERIFDRFYRVDKARSRDTGGTGLGLSIAKKILEAHEEDLKVESTLGSGTRFWFELPLVEE